MSWREIPLHYVILERVKKRSPVTDQELYQEVKKSVGYEVSFSDFLKALMKLEMRGYLHVVLVKENVRMVSISQG
ncbi:hypothetical protein [Sulfolobus acidocaldarius]|uniref:Conserved protein n=4 Tax=Sulfolobus acidocaldarius TaxID=2285 RepID=Q4JAN2_SULAC|nr:hypothetical protein [Sulfolobus acidocaldarius]AHC51130.1 hypothetical protein SUSAZ_03490 [Sulfolobus acidocaldarius SUSAZ]AAY80147.1 conserved protein [Sulfolobus acidocaldarius DSM 639]AGE70723.1 hypothetical protein SacN8_03755 [Sulfolobus acidocaldarius N8]AGE72995.1 hypothetical protein SacRon12I_03740 [Sulfolobus acidocaldarius Ron12/I]ALU28942.1 hypothetical protein ATY89_02530 [Sulfolobus acidocaldarius]